jgi:peroxiredoxin
VLIFRLHSAVRSDDLYLFFYADYLPVRYFFLEANMAATPSAMIELGTPAPAFNLPDTKGKNVSTDDFAEAKALLVVFMCNHCPYVKHVINGFIKLVNDFKDKGLAVVGISSNDIDAFPDDAPDKMAEWASELQFPFPYLYDSTQETAKAFHAACTPDFFLFGKRRVLLYRGQMDDSRPGNDKPVTGADLRAAIEAVLEGKPAAKDQKASIGCNIKWIPGNEPKWMKK